MRIHLLCDQKWRDLPNLAVLKLHLEALGHRVLLSTIKDVLPMVNAFRPDCIVFNHLFTPFNQTVARALRASGTAVVVLPTEGAARPELQAISEGEFADFRPMDLYLAWNDVTAKGIRERWGFDSSVVRTLGCPRIDFYTPNLRAAVTPRDQFCRQHDIDPGRPIVTWATTYHLARAVDDAAAYRKFESESAVNGYTTCCRRVGVEPVELPAIHAKGRQESAAAFFALAAARPQLQFIIRPHPAETHDFYLSHIKDRGLKNVRFCPRDFIWNILNASNIHLHRQCTTAVEAWMWEKPTIEMKMDYDARLQWPDREAGSQCVTTDDELIAAVDRYAGGADVDAATRTYQKNYIQCWFGALDGNRCSDAAEAVDTMLRARGARRHYFTALTGLRSSPRQVVSAVARYALDMRPNESFARRGPPKTVDPQDKQISRSDVRAYSRLVASALN